jgi:putative chitinase
MAPLITEEEIRRLCPHAARWIVDGIVEHQDLLRHAAIDTPLRLCHFLAQLCTESDHLKVTREYASGAAYEGRRDLGNTQLGDGRRYRGRGLIQTTGRANYAEALREIAKLGIACPDFEADPERMEEFPWALLGGVVYWNKRNINRHADRDDVMAVTKAVNGGLNGFDYRQTYLAKAKTIWPMYRDVTASAGPTKIHPDLKERLPNVVQTLLAACGHDPGPIDGDIGKRTSAAYEAFLAQRDGPGPAAAA